MHSGGEATTVVILGVERGARLLAERYRPAVPTVGPSFASREGYEPQ